MADLLLFWLNHELRLSSVVTDLNADFASGYLLGEVLHQLNQQHNFADFLRSTTADAKIVNFCLLEPTLRNLNVRFDATRAAAIMNEQRGAAADLLYQIKMAAARMQRAPAVSTRSFEETKVVPLHNRPVKLVKPAYDAGNHRFFEHSIRHHVQSVASLKHQKDIAAQEMSRHQAYLAAKQEEKKLLEITKAERLHKAFIHSRFIKEALEETDSPAWRLALETKHAREQRRATFYRQLLAKHHKAQDDLTFSLRRTVQDDLDAFERQEADKTRRATRLPQRKSSGYGLRSLTTALGKSTTETNDFVPTARSEDCAPTGNEAQRDSSMIKQKKLQREKRREALERRRKRFLQGCGVSHANFAGVRVTSVLETLALRSTNREREMQEEIERISRFKEIARENRELRSIAYGQQRDEDSLRRVNRDGNHYGLLLQRFDDDVRIQRSERRQLGVAIDAASHSSVEVIARDITNELVQFTLFVAGKREETLFAREPSVFLDAETWMELCTLFAEGKSLFGHTHRSNDDEDSTDQSRLLDTREFDKYLLKFRPVRSAVDYVGSTAKVSSVSPWHPRDSRFVGAAEVLEECYVLGEEIKYLRWIDRTFSSHENPPASTSDASEDEVTALEWASGDEIPSSVGSLDTFENELRILIFGPPFSGKATQANLLASKYNLHLFSIHQLLQDAIASKSEFGLQLERRLADGMEVTAGQYARLAVDAIQARSRNCAQLPSTDPGASPKTSGWIIYDLPSTEEQGLRLEELLSGYVDPRSIPSPFDLESPIAPGCVKPALQSSFFHGKSGVDLVFYLRCDEKAVMERCFGLLEDAETGTTWHLQHNPPPEDATFRYRLSHANHSLNASELLSVHVLTSESTADGHNAWHSKFGTLRDISGESAAGTSDETHQIIASHVEEFIQEQTHKNLVRQQDKEDGELLLMIREANRQVHIAALDSAIAEAQEELARRQQALQQAEEVKAKKEELAELRASVEAGRQRVEQCTLDAKSWVMEEQTQLQASMSTYSGELTPRIARVLAQMWNDMESQYISMMNRCFSRIRQQRAVVAERSQTMVVDFCTFVRRSDTKQALVNLFHQRFNEVLDEMRFDDATKDELHARTDILQDELCAVIASKTTEDEAELASLVSDGWTEDTCRSIALIYQSALQAECDRFRFSLQVLVEGYSAASRNRPVLLHLVETTQTQIARLDFTCRVFRDPSGQSVDEIPAQPPAPTTPAPPATKAAAAKGKGKQPSAAAATASAAAKENVPSAAGEQIKEGTGDATTIEDMQIMYDTVVQKCEALFAAVMAVPSAAEGHKDASGYSVAEQHDESDAAATNLRKGIKFEHEQMLQRVRFLREVAAAASDNVTRAIRAVEQSLRQVIDERKRGEEGAVASLIHHIRAAIESESNLPCVINVAPPPVYRFPPTARLPKDTLVTIESARRLVPLAPPEEPPVIEKVHDLLLNERQQKHLHAALGWTSRRLLPACQLVDVMKTAASLPDALPKTWRARSEVAFAEVASKCMRRRQGFVDVDVFVDIMANSEQELRRIVHEDQSRQEAALKSDAAAVADPVETELAATS